MLYIYRLLSYFQSHSFLSFFLSFSLASSVFDILQASLPASSSTSSPSSGLPPSITHAPCLSLPLSHSLSHSLTLHCRLAPKAVHLLSSRWFQLVGKASWCRRRSRLSWLSWPSGRWAVVGRLSNARAPTNSLHSFFFFFLSMSCKLLLWVLRHSVEEKGEHFSVRHNLSAWPWLEKEFSYWTIPDLVVNVVVVGGILIQGESNTSGYLLPVLRTRGAIRVSNAERNQITSLKIWPGNLIGSRPTVRCWMFTDVI